YRLFTSRSEFRLLLRQDNALRRLAPLAERLRLLTAPELRQAEQRLREEERLLDTARATPISPAQADPALAQTGTQLAEPERVATVARRPGVSLRALLEAAGVAVPSDDDVVASAEIELKYDGYLAREREAASRLAELAAFVLPAELPYLEMRSLATEARQKLDRVRPTSLAQAARIPGVSPSDLHNLVVETAHQRRRHRTRSHPPLPVRRVARRPSPAGRALCPRALPLSRCRPGHPGSRRCRAGARRQTGARGDDAPGFTGDPRPVPVRHHRLS